MWIRKAIPWVTGFCLGAVSTVIFYKSAVLDPLPHSRTSPVSTASVTPDTAASLSGPVGGSEFEARLARQVALAVQAALTDWFTQNNPQAVAQSAARAATEAEGERPLTQDQQRIYDALRARLRVDAQSGLSWGQLTAAPEMKQLPKEWRDKIYAEAVQMLNSGELNPNQFLRLH